MVLLLVGGGVALTLKDGVLTMSLMMSVTMKLLLDQEEVDAGVVKLHTLRDKTKRDQRNVVRTV